MTPDEDRTARLVDEMAAMSAEDQLEMMRRLPLADVRRIERVAADSVASRVERLEVLDLLLVAIGNGVLERVARAPSAREMRAQVADDASWALIVLGLLHGPGATPSQETLRGEWLHEIERDEE
ncbi:MAG TPA: hypothetical protein VEJ23_06940 [Solirubrobacteraceae bacterium]|nr:hypothetical protein [Solirubrobacteraceae bacterium]